MPLNLLPALLLLSGAGALTCELVWMRRLALVSGSSAVALTFTLSTYMAGLGIGGLWASRRQWATAPRGYGILELAAAGWALSMPALVHALDPLLSSGALWASALGATLALLPPAILHGATLPALGPLVARTGRMARLYAANTTGAVTGVLFATLLLLPHLGVRGAELTGAALSGLAGVGALVAAGRARRPPASPEAPTPGAHHSPPRVLAAVAAAGGATMALEVCWSRLGALLLGGSVYAFAVVLAVVLAGIALGAELGRRQGRRALGPALLGMAALGVAGVATWRWLPHVVALLWDQAGGQALLPGGAAVLVLATGGAPIASGAVFAAALDDPEASSTSHTGRLLATNTVGSVAGAALAGLALVPAFGLQATALGAALLCGGVGLLCLRRDQRRGGLALAAAATALAIGAPRWDPALYAVGLGLRVHEFADLSPRAVERFAHDGWTLRMYRDGRSASVAVGQSTRTGNLWLSLNGKVDASTGDDMPTQVLSGRLPTRLMRARTTDDLDAAVVGLASGITAHAVLEAGAGSVTVLELEPAVVEAAEHFADFNGGILEDPRATVRVEDARAWLARPGPPVHLLVSEPSNPWITGVSNLFTQEYWALGHDRLVPGGLFVQWVQLYALPPEAFRSLVHTFQTVFDDVWLFETIPGADALLIGTTRGARLTAAEVGALELAPTLSPAQVDALAAGARLNTDDQPWVEFAAPRWLHRETARANRALLQGAAGPTDP